MGGDFDDGGRGINLPSLVTERENAREANLTTIDQLRARVLNYGNSDDTPVVLRAVPRVPSVIGGAVNHDHTGGGGGGGSGGNGSVAQDSAKPSGTFHIDPSLNGTGEHRHQHAVGRRAQTAIGVEAHNEPPSRLRQTPSRGRARGLRNVRAVNPEGYAILGAYPVPNDYGTRRRSSKTSGYGNYNNDFNNDNINGSSSGGGAGTRFATKTSYPAYIASNLSGYSTGYGHNDGDSLDGTNAAPMLSPFPHHSTTSVTSVASCPNVQPVIGHTHIETTRTRYYLPVPDDIVGLPGTRKGLGYKTKSALFFSRFDVEDVGEAYTLTNWLHVDDVPRQPSDPADIIATGGLQTPDWVEKAYHTMYCARLPQRHERGEGWRAGGGATSRFKAPSVGVDFEPRDRALKATEIRTLEATVEYVTRLRPRTQEDCRPLIELMAALLRHLVIEMQSTYWAMSRHFKELERHLKEEYERRVAAAEKEINATAVEKTTEAAKKARVKTILDKMTRAVATAHAAKVRALEAQLHETLATGKSTAEQLQSQKEEIVKLQKSAAIANELKAAGWDVADPQALKGKIEQAKMDEEMLRGGGGGGGGGGGRRKPWDSQYNNPNSTTNELAEGGEGGGAEEGQRGRGANDEAYEASTAAGAGVRMRRSGGTGREGRGGGGGTEGEEGAKKEKQSADAYLSHLTATSSSAGESCAVCGRVEQNDVKRRGRTTLKMTIREAEAPIARSHELRLGGGATAAKGLKASDASRQRIACTLLELETAAAGECFKLMCADAASDEALFDSLRSVLMTMKECDAARIIEATGDARLAARFVAAVPMAIGGCYLMQMNVDFGSEILRLEIPDDNFHMENAFSVPHFYEKYHPVLRIKKPQFEKIINTPVTSHARLQEDAVTAIKRMGFYNDALLDTVVYFCVRSESEPMTMRIFATNHPDMYVRELNDSVYDDFGELMGRSLFEAEREARSRLGPFQQIAAEGWDLDGNLFAIPIAQRPLPREAEDGEADFMRTAKPVPEPGTAWGVVVGPANKNASARPRGHRYSLRDDEDDGRRLDWSGKEKDEEDCDPEMMDLLTDFSHALAFSASSLNNSLEKQTNLRETEESGRVGVRARSSLEEPSDVPAGPPPPVIPIRMEKTADQGVLVIDGEELSWNSIHSWTHADKEVNIFVLDRRDPRLVLRRNHFFHPDAEAMDGGMDEILQNLTEDEIVVLQCSEWQPANMAVSKKTLHKVVAAETVVKKVSDVDTTARNLTGDGYSFIVTSARGENYAAETFGTSWEGWRNHLCFYLGPTPWAVRDPGDGLYHVIDKNHCLASIEILDILSEESPSEEGQLKEEMAVQMLLTRHNESIWRIFQNYCVVAASAENNPFMMTLIQFKQFVKEAFMGVKEAKDNTLIERIFALVNQAMKSIDNKDVHDRVEDLQGNTAKFYGKSRQPTQKQKLAVDDPKTPSTSSRDVTGKVKGKTFLMDRDEFKEAIIRLCLVFFGGWGQKPEHQASKNDGAAEADAEWGSLYALGPVKDSQGNPLPVISPSMALAEGLNNFVLVNAKRLFVDVDFKTAYDEKEVRRRVKSGKALLLTAFKHAAFNNPRGTLEHNEWILFCRNVQLLGSSLSMTALSRMFLEIVDTEDEPDLMLGRQSEAAQLLSVYRVTSEAGMKYEDFCEAVARCAAIVYEGKADNLADLVDMAVEQNLNKHMAKVENMRYNGRHKKAQGRNKR